MPDEYERAFMPGEGALHYRDKVTIPRWAFAVVAGLPLAFGVVGAWALAAASASPSLAALPLVGAALLSLLVSGVLLVFASGRIAVSDGELHLQIGPAGPRIAMDELESVEVKPSWSRARGLGVKTTLGQPTLYNLLGDPAHAVWLRFKSERKPLVIVPRDAAALASALRKAMAPRPNLRAEGPRPPDAFAHVEAAELEDEVVGVAEGDETLRR